MLNLNPNPQTFMFPKYLSRRASARGFTFIDVMGAALIVALFLSGTFYGNSRALNMLRASKETIIASKILQQRMEQVRASNWTEVTDAISMQATYATAADASVGLNGVIETLTISIFPSVSGTNIKISRSTAGLATVVTDNPNLVDGNAVRVDARVTWTGTPGGITRVREMSTIVANGGLGR